ncbi:hypothetical protein [Gloeobacter kilaueensis]|uniref:Uncharacterized protein n=1 Tax=Gloeobacter kilaueensis (strain ATCC BAA-2537 / CCAP 1431/1 / ULC 316 / JS1) TaxID=1183438 RepID=U5QL20_GLOK1|nr:hypothetical protein [Gloeobacter kilaueensis]AGY58345.1 hypothetical protein GKIL_2099 [Gloeobacter kilaueensis JS1]
MKKLFPIGFSLAAVGALMLLVPTDAIAQSNQWRQQVGSYLAKAARAALPGYQLEGKKYFTGGLTNNRTTFFNVALNQSTGRRALLAVCDQYCSDVDLRLIYNGKVVAQDVSVSDYPTIKIGPEIAGKFQVQVVMRGCKTKDPCYYGIGLFKQAV